MSSVDPSAERGSAGALRRHGVPVVTPRARLFVAAALAVTLLAACGGSHRVATDPEPQFGPAQRVGVWHGAGADTLTAVVISADTLRGLHEGTPVSLALADVDSLTTRSGAEAGWFALPVVAAGVALLIWRVSDGD